MDDEEGLSITIMPDGRRYEGCNVNGVWHGEGKLYFDTGKLIWGRWETNKIK
eukprot:CAMPEP_0201281242 /NCGR_PEP_ID=MMETSP1317-20130820/2024_1 /ASSEMBLY_ACC=CAM_ASM_000770 /TAXON_ID=187299 /ORGANISM="Undescribed Undescribed, Strain Undescribed" /LENGTH=51 /DNA_ID=CAMNT_0047590567 /DNA_START=1619 /DNA_END=1774 /DNA_ORIENTATION=+